MNLKKIFFNIQNKCFEITNDGVLKSPCKWWQHIYIIYNWTIYEQFLFVMNFIVTSIFFILSFIEPYKFAGGDTLAKCYIIAVVSLVGNVSNIMSIILSSKKRISTFAWGIVACATLGTTSFLSKAIGTSIVYVIIQLPMQFVGFHTWRRNSVNKVQVTPRRMSWWWIILTIMIIALATTGFYYLEQMDVFQKFWNGGNTNNNQIMVVCDSLTFVLGTTAMFMMIFAIREQWLLWIILDIAIIVTFSVHTNPQMIAMSATALLDAFYGVWNWWRKVENKEYE